MAGDLTPKQALFVKEYLIDLNATQAAIRAGYSEKTAYSIGVENLNKPEIASAIQTEMDKRAARTEITADRVLEEIAKLAFFDIGKLYDENGNLRKISELPPEVSAAIASVKVRRVKNDSEAEDEEIEVRPWDKCRALEMAGKHLKLFTEKFEHSGKFTLEALVCGDDGD